MGSRLRDSGLEPPQYPLAAAGDPGPGIVSDTAPRFEGPALELAGMPLELRAEIVVIHATSFPESDGDRNERSGRSAASLLLLPAGL